jgi:hypothetical protein
VKSRKLDAWIHFSEEEKKRPMTERVGIEVSLKKKNRQTKKKRK